MSRSVCNCTLGNPPKRSQHDQMAVSLGVRPRADLTLPAGNPYWKIKTKQDRSRAKTLTVAANSWWMPAHSRGHERSPAITLLESLDTA